MELSRLLAEDTAAHIVSELNTINGNMTHQRTTSVERDVLPTPTEITPTANLPPKHVIFEYLLTETAQQRARLPMRVNIYPHDGTDSIITTVKNFYGLYDGNGVSFEDKEGNTLIARYENFQDKMVIYVRVVDDVGSSAGTPSQTTSPRRPRLGPAFEMMPANGEQALSRPPSRTARKRSASPPSMLGHRSVSVGTNKSRQRMGLKSRVGSAHGEATGEYDSDSDGGNASVTSSRRGKIDVVASAEISVDNIVEGGRRKRARFDSSELPLFVPSQVPMPVSVSSISPQRRIGPTNTASPFQYSNQQTFSYTAPLPSPQSYNHSDMSFKANLQYTTTGNSGFGARGRNGGHMSGRLSISGTPGGILPTPDPTIGSVISDEDVALQLMRLGDASNFSTHGRTSTGTLDDALSGKAEAASSEEDSEDGSVADENQLPLIPFGPRPVGIRNSLGSDESEDDYDDRQDGSFKEESDKITPEEFYKKHKTVRSMSKSSTKVRKWKVKTSEDPASPASLTALSRKTSNASLNFQHFQKPFGEDEEDLSTKPRCQRCRKSKKGCDRQRPCGRCRDAGIGIEGCVSEDEGNGRKGRFGRHMGVPIKKGTSEAGDSMDLDGPQTFTAPTAMAPPPLVSDKSKKRKR